jgi:type II secretory pathway pseudopilin PulG
MLNSPNDSKNNLGMKIKIALLKRIRQAAAAFSLVEATVSMGVVGTALAALFTGYTSGFFTMQMARENLRATQIMLEKMETIRLYSWDQIRTPGFVPVAFTNFYDPQAPVGQKGVAYRGTMTISDCTIGSTYRTDMKKVTVKVDWATGHLQRSRQFTSYISRYGLQDYIY